MALFSIPYSSQRQLCDLRISFAYFRCRHCRCHRHSTIAIQPATTITMQTGTVLKVLLLYCWLLLLHCVCVLCMLPLHTVFHICQRETIYRHRHDGLRHQTASLRSAAQRRQQTDELFSVIFASLYPDHLNIFRNLRPCFIGICCVSHTKKQNKISFAIHSNFAIICTIHSKKQNGMRWHNSFHLLGAFNAHSLECSRLI